MSSPYPQNTLFSDEFLRQIPKTDLHCHLDGSVRVETLVELCREQNLPLPASTAEELNRVLFKDEYNSLEEYLECFGYVTAALRTADALERVGYEFAVDQYRIGVRYFECRFAPQLNANGLQAGATYAEPLKKLVDFGTGRRPRGESFKRHRALCRALRKTMHVSKMRTIATTSRPAS